jgi:hypothetical protein
MKIVKELLQQTKKVIINMEKHKPLDLVLKGDKYNDQRSNTYSYGKFVQENPKATRQERRDALKKFLDSTR